MSRRDELLAEAKLWRQAAEWSPVRLAFALRWVYPHMLIRWRQHSELAMDPHLNPPTKHSGPLTCLLLALECRAEAKACRARPSAGETP